MRATKQERLHLGSPGGGRWMRWCLAIALTLCVGWTGAASAVDSSSDSVQEDPGSTAELESAIIERHSLIRPLLEDQRGHTLELGDPKFDEFGQNSARQRSVTPLDSNISVVLDPLYDVFNRGADLTSAGILLDDDGTMFAAVFVDIYQNPYSNIDWVLGLTGPIWYFDTDNDGSLDYYAAMLHIGGDLVGGVFNEDGDLVCNVDATTSPGDNGYGIGFNTSCIGNPAQVSWSSAMVYEDISLGFTEVDFAPDSGWVGPVDNPSYRPPTIRPSAPRAVRAVPGDGLVTVSWSPPSSNGGDSNLRYTVAGTPAGSCRATSPTTSCVVGGLSNGVPHTFTVVAANSAGTGPRSVQSSPVTPVSPYAPGSPSAPRSVVVDRDTTTATISWRPPADDGGDPAMSYTVKSSPSGITCAARAPSTTCSVTGLTNWISYSFWVEPRNSNGTGRPSLPTSPVMSEALVDCSAPIAHPLVDVSTASFAYHDVGCIYALGVTTGTSSRTYSPADLVSREQMAAFIARLFRTITGEPCGGGAIPFNDVSTTSFARSEIGCIYGLGITTGTTPTTYSPTSPVSREQMAAFIARLYRSITGESCVGGWIPFRDVSMTSFARSDIGCIFKLGITTGTSPTTYSPSNFVTREQMAAFIARLYEEILQ